MAMEKKNKNNVCVCARARERERVRSAGDGMCVFFFTRVSFLFLKKENDVKKEKEMKKNSRPVFVLVMTGDVVEWTKT